MGTLQLGPPELTVTSRSESKPSAPSRGSENKQPSSVLTAFKDDKDRLQAFLVEKPEPAYDHAGKMKEQMKSWDKTWEDLDRKSSK